MNKRSLTVLFCSLSALILSACIITSGPSGGVGGGTTTNGTGGEAPSGGVGGGTGDSSSSGVTCDPTYKCAAAITDNDPNKLCKDSDSYKLFEAYDACACTTGCATECQSSFCAGKEAESDCGKCTQDKCKEAATNCANDQ